MPRHPDAIIVPNAAISKARQDLPSPRRPRQCMSRHELADAVNQALDELYPDEDLNSQYVDFRWVGKLERGEHRWPSEHRRAALRHVFGVSTDNALDLYSPRRTDELRNQQAAAAHPVSTAGSSVEALQLQVPAAGLQAMDLAAVRGALDSFDVPPDGPVRSPTRLRQAVAAVVRMRLTSNYRRLAATIPPLLDELHRARLAADEECRPAVAILLTQVYRAADALADKFGHYDLSARIITMMTDAARQTGSELIVAMSQYVRGELFFQNGRPDLGRMMLERAAECVDPHSDLAAHAVYGSLHMRAAVLAGQAAQPRHARDHLLEAAEHAHLLPDGEYQGTAFGPSSVRIHEVTLAIDTNDPDAALRAAADWSPPAGLPGERKSHFYIDIARAHAQLGSTEMATNALLQARASAREHTRIHPQVHRLVSDLLPRVPAGGRLGEYAAWTQTRSATALRAN